MTIICYQVLLSGRLSFFSLCSLILHGFPLTSFHLPEASLSAFSWLYTLVCAFVQKYHKLSFIYNCSYFQYSFCNQPFLFAKLENVNKQWNNNRTINVNERNQSKNKKIKSRHIQIDQCVLLFDLTHKQCSGITKGWLHCLTSDSSGRLLGNNIFMFGSA